MRGRGTALALIVSLGIVPAPLAAQPQPARNAPRVGWLTSSVVHRRNLDAFRQRMGALGYQELRIESRAAAGHMEQLPALAAELVALNVDVIVVDGGPAVRSAKQATATIPIVIGATASDLVGQGLVASLARPGGNLTGFTISTGAELYGKRLELLREAIPRLDRVAVVRNPRNETTRASLPAIEAAARILGMELELVEVTDARALERALGNLAGRRPGALLTVADAFLWSQREQVVTAAARHRLPGMYPEVEFAEAGGLMAYGPDIADNFRRAAGYVDRILRGARPGDLPIEQPSTFRLVVNLKTARALGLAIPPSVLARADEVIE
jgi:putative ABC transport system substrate-binding protein